MSDETRGQITGNYGPAKGDVKLSKPDLIAKITIYYYDSQAYPNGYKFFNKTGECLLTWGNCGGNATKDYILLDGERVVGFKSRLFTQDSPFHNDVQFIIGRLE